MAVTIPMASGNGPVAGSTEAVDSAVMSDSLQTADSAAVADSLKGEELEGLILVNPVTVEPAPKMPATGMSWVYVGMAVLFCAMAYQVHGSGRYFRALLNDLHDTRERHNVFDDTVKETSFLIMVNVLWAASMGVLLWYALPLADDMRQHFSFSIPDRPAPGIGICAGVCLVYDLMMMAAYWMVGNVFTDSRRTAMWVRGAAASNGLSTIILFPLALLVLTQTQWTSILLIIAAITFVLAKLVFIFKGFRIFFSKISSWLLFLYYLCSLEIIPLLLTYVLTLMLCSEWL